MELWEYIQHMLLWKVQSILRERMWCRMGIRDIGSSPGQAMNLLWELGQLPSWLWASVPLSVLRSRSCAQFIGEQPLSAFVAMSDISSQWTCGWFWSQVLWQGGSHSLWKNNYQNHPGLSDHSQHHHGMAVPCTEWVFSKCLLQDCIRLSCGQQRPGKTMVWTG